MTKKKSTKTKAKTKTKKQQKAEKELTSYIGMIVVVMLLIIALSRAGAVGIYLSNFFRFLFGDLYYLYLGAFVLHEVWRIFSKGKKKLLHIRTYIAIALIIAVITTVASLKLVDNTSGFAIFNDFVARFKTMIGETYPTPAGGGLLGAFLLSLFTSMFDIKGTIVVLVGMGCMALILIISLDAFDRLKEFVYDFFTVPEDDDDDEEEYVEPEPEPEPLPAPSRPAKVAGTIDKPAKKKTFLSYDNSPEPSDNDDKQLNLPPKQEYTPMTQPITPMGIINVPKVDEPLILDDMPDEDPWDQIPAEPVAEPQPVITEKLVSEPVDEMPSMDNVVEASDQPTGEISGTSDKVNNYRNYRLPKYDMLDKVLINRNSEANIQAAGEKGKRLIETLEKFGVQAELKDVHIGPAVTKFEIRPDSTVKVSKLVGLADNLKMELAARDIRIEAPIPGVSAVGVEIPNVEVTPVKMRDLINKISDDDKKNPLLFALGKDLMNAPVFCKLNKMPHLLIAGATGSGKSVCMNAIITSFLLRTRPDEVKLLLVDPKKVEFTPYVDIPHLIGPIINDPMQASTALKVIVQIMDERYEVFSQNGVRNIEVYNEKVKAGAFEQPLKPLPYIVVIIDELADLMAVAGKEVEVSIQRITQLARAAGIHLIVATQRPSTDVITGIIKANIPSRIAFSVSSGIDSRTIIDHTGAERLLGNGDMLYMPIGQSGATRLQGVYVTDEEVVRITEFCKKQAKPFYDDAFIRLEGVQGNEGTAVMDISDDPLFQEIKEYVIDVQKASTSLLQRRFGIGYNRAARMIDMLEEKGIIGPQQGSKPREVYIRKSDD